MSKQTNRYILIFGLFMTIASFMGIFAPKTVEAGGSGPSCFVYVQSTSYRKLSACPSDPSIDANSTSCYFQPDTTQGQGQTTFTVIDCGAVAQKLENTDTGGKNNTPPQTTPEPITNAERDALANCDGRTNPKQCLENNPLVRWTLVAINFLAAGVGVVVTIMIIIGGIQYASAGSNPQQVQAAKKKIANAIIALVAFFFLFAFMQYLIPGGIF